MRTMTGPSQPDYTRKLTTTGFVMGMAALAGQYIFFQPLFRQLGMGPIMSAFGMFMFFTVLTNSMLVAAYWSSLADRPRRLVRFFRQTGVRTALAAHIALVAIVYITAIRGHVPMTLPMQVTDALLHYLAPVVYLAWWWRLPGKQAIGYTDIPRWMAWPVFYSLLHHAGRPDNGRLHLPDPRRDPAGRDHRRGQHRPHSRSAGGPMCRTDIHRQTAVRKSESSGQVSNLAGASGKKALREPNLQKGEELTGPAN